MRGAGVVIAVVLFAACYAPSAQPGAPCPDGVCPSGLVCAPATQTCERTAVPADASVDDASELDAPVDAPEMVTVDAPPDAAPCYGAGLITICPSAPVTDSLAITANTTLDTDTSPLCIVYSGGELDVCVVAATTISIAATQRLHAIGTRPLVLLATGAMTIDGTLDVTFGAGANPATCVAPTAATGKQGGAGGSWQGRGGSGGNAVSGTGPVAAPGTTTVALRGGCRGGSGAGGGSPGAGGSGGGAVYLIAQSIAIDGAINASGAGGARGRNASGGGGGGAGGFIGLDAPAIMVATDARVFANGGGGGEGGTPNKDGNSGSTPNDPGTATGGAGGANHGGNGGAGAAGTLLDGDDGRAGGTCDRGGASGGGGGGGAGFIYVYPAQVLGGTVSPAPGS